jgi:hypothetical protein
MCRHFVVSSWFLSTGVDVVSGNEHSRLSVASVIEQLLIGNLANSPFRVMLVAPVWRLEIFL